MAAQDVNGQWIGQTGGIADVINPATPVQATPDYTSGDCIGTVITISNAVRAGVGTALLSSVLLTDAASQGFGLELLFFSSNPSAATTTDNSAFVISTDVSKLLARVSIATSDWVSVGGVNVASIGGIGKLLKANPVTGTDLYMVIVAKGAFNFAATTDLKVFLGIAQD